MVSAEIVTKAHIALIEWYKEEEVKLSLIVTINIDDKRIFTARRL